MIVSILTKYNLSAQFYFNNVSLLLLTKDTVRKRVKFEEIIQHQAQRDAEDVAIVTLQVNQFLEEFVIAFDGLETD